MSEKVLLIGGFVEMVELCESCNYDIVGFIDNKDDLCIKDIPYLGSDENIKNLKDTYSDCKIVLSPDLPSIRKKLANFYKLVDYEFITVISPSASVSKSAVINSGTVIQNRVNISSEVNIGKFVKINTMSNIMHNSTIGDFTTVAPNAVVLGYVKIGSSCYIGANAIILPHISICDNVTIGAGAVVTKDIIEPNSTYVGVPAQKLIKRE